MSKQPVIVIIDDDDAPREMLTDFCESLGYTAQAFINPETAQTALDKGIEIELIILDVFIKGKSSLWFVDYLKKTRYTDIPIIIISGAISPEHIQEALTKGVYDFVSKPFTLQQIKERIENALHFCLNVKQNKSYHSQVETLLRERTTLLENLAFQSVKALANSIEARDPYTRGHSERVAELSVKIGEAMGFEEEARTKLNLAGLLHDVGKVGIPDRILLKPGKLTEFEYTIMKEHPNMSALIVNEIDPLKSIVPWIQCHHENFDGSGYPAKLSKQKIPVEAQIISLADNFDAMISMRPYRKKMDKDVVLSCITSDFGKKFNPELKKVALDVLGAVAESAGTRTTVPLFIEKFRDAMIYIDFLTGLYWYPYLKNFIDDHIAKKQAFVLAYVDIEGTAEINRRFGRIKGDALIVSVAKTLQTIFLDPSVVVRAGGDDFILFTHLSGQEVMAKIQDIRIAVDNCAVVLKTKLYSYPEDGASFDELIARSLDV